MIAIQRWAVYCLMTGALAAAVLLKGGVRPQQWIWSALAVSAAAVMAGSARVGVERQPCPGLPSRPGLFSSDKCGLGLMGILLAWMMLQQAPLPPALVARLTPEHWHAVAAARAATGQNLGAWVSLSVAPSATFSRLLDVVPAMAAFVVASEMAWWWQDCIWIAVAPVVGVALLESLIGLAQFYFMRTLSADATSATGTYVNRNHFAGLLELAAPVAVMLAVSAWRKGNQTAGAALQVALMSVTSACLLAGVVVSQSRMGFVSTIAGAGLTILAMALLMPRSGRSDANQEDTNHSRANQFDLKRSQAWRLTLAVAPVLISILLPTRELILRFADMASSQEVSKDDRLNIWRDTLHFARAYAWTGSGLGAYQHGFFRYQTVAPASTVDFAHNDYLQILVELGVPGSLLVVALAAWIAARILTVVLGGRLARNWELAVGLMASLVTLAVHGLADFNLYIPANALVLAWLGGVAASPGLRGR